MKKKKPIKMLLMAALIAVSGSVFAQVKIGTNPTTIDPANNLEVEASTVGRKTSINKTTGQVTIADGTQGTTGSSIRVTTWLGCHNKGVYNTGKWKL
jgi:hypothetical protein